MWTIILASLSALLCFYLLFQLCSINNTKTTRRAANVQKMRHRMRIGIIFITFIQTISAFILSQRFQFNTTKISVQLRGLPKLGWLSFYIFIGCFLLQTCRLVSGSGDDAGKMKVRHLQIIFNTTLVLGYTICSIAVGVIDPLNSWKWVSYYLGMWSVFGGIVVCYLGNVLIKHIDMVPDIETTKRNSIISGTKFVSMICSICMILGGLYEIVLATTVLGNTGPYPIDGNDTVADISEAIHLGIPLLLATLLLFTTRKGKKKQDVRQTPLLR